jgi:RimJ/RimL family protein N-acetyltransferase
MIKLIPIKSLDEIQEERDNYLNGLPYAQGLNTEENVWTSRYYKIQINSAYVGYICVDSQKTLWEFYLIESAQTYSQEVFKFLIEMNYIVAAESKSFDSLLMALCFDFHKKATCNAYLFRDDTDVEYLPGGFENIEIRLAAKDDLKNLTEINRFAEDVDFFYNLDEEIRKEEIFVFVLNGEFLGAGTCKRICRSLNYYDIGMIVTEKHRNKGLGTYIIIKLKEYCYNSNKVPVCDCYYLNYPSKKTLEKAGFISKHRMVRFEFKDTL